MCVAATRVAYVGARKYAAAEVGVCVRVAAPVAAARVACEGARKYAAAEASAAAPATAYPEPEIRQHASAYVRMRQNASAYVNMLLQRHILNFKLQKFKSSICVSREEPFEARF